MFKLLVPIFCLPLLIFSCKPGQEKTKPIEESITESVYASGIVKSRNQYQVYSTVTGLIQHIFVTEGDFVKKGDPIITLVDETARLNSENARLATEFATANAKANGEKLNELKIKTDLAKSKMANDALLLERQRNLWSQNIGTRNELEQRELAYKNSAAEFNSASLTYEDLKKQLDFNARQAKKSLQVSNSIAKDYTIRSEINGKVYNVLKEQGAIINPQIPVAIIGDGNDFLLQLQVDEYDIAKIKLGQKVVLTMDSYRGQLFEAKVDKIYPLMNDRSRTFTIDAMFVTMPPRLYPNLNVEANIIIQTKEKALIIPRNYLIDDSFVLMQNKEKRKVLTGLKDYQKVEITEGLNTHDIILNPIQ